MKLKLLLLLAGGFAVMFVLGWVPTVKVGNDTFEMTCRACSRALSIGWGAVESEPTGVGGQTGGAVSPSGGAWRGPATGLRIGGPSPDDQRSDVMKPEQPSVSERNRQPVQPAQSQQRGVLVIAG